MLACTTRVVARLSREEIGQLMKHVEGVTWLIVALLYGAGLRLEECLELRVKDLDFDRHQIVVRRGKGQKDRVTMLPGGVTERLAAHLLTVKRQHERDLARGEGRVALPFALDRKYPAAPTEWGWQFVVPATRICRDPRWGPSSRFHVHYGSRGWLPPPRPVPWLQPTQTERSARSVVLTCAVPVT
jgi:integrase